jgi:hypothetical protein
MKLPTPQQVKNARLAAGLSATQAAALVYRTKRQWQYYEADRAIDPAVWELFNIKLKATK